MITEDYVSFETAKLLKEKGFDGKCSRLYAKEENAEPLCIAMSLFVEGEEIADRETVEQATRYNNKYRFKTPVIAYLRPTLQMAMKWLREVHKIGVFPSTYTTIKGNDITHTYGTAIINLSTYELMTFDSMDRETYEDACEVAIKYCLEKLV